MPFVGQIMEAADHCVIKNVRELCKITQLIQNFLVGVAPGQLLNSGITKQCNVADYLMSNGL